MSQFYDDPEREYDPHALPYCETFYLTVAVNKQNGFLDADGKPMPSGWYYWYCFPGCLPDSDPFGPFDTEAEAIADARENSGSDDND